MSSDPLANDDVIAQLPTSLQTLMTFERFHLHNLDRYQHTSASTDFDRRYFPQNCGPFALPCFWVRRGHLRIFGTQERNELSFFEGNGRHQEVLLPIHPTSLQRYDQFLRDVGARDARADGLHVWAVPSSSTRTLLVWPDRCGDKALFVKTSLHSSILGDRRVSLKTAARSVGLSTLIRYAQHELPSTLGFFYEPVGFVPRRMPDSGVILRSLPTDIMNGRIVVAPLFSLIGGSGTHVPLLLTLLEGYGGEPLQLVDDLLCAPFAALWLRMTMSFGLFLEAHGQDLMLVLSPELRPLHRFFYRDFEGLQVDWELRRRQGLRTPDGLPNACSWFQTYETWGYPQSQLVWYKLYMSLANYVQFVLGDLELQWQKWQDAGVLAGRRLRDGDIKRIFVRHLMEAFGDTLNCRSLPDHDVSGGLNRLVALIMKLRKRRLEQFASIGVRAALASYA